MPNAEFNYLMAVHRSSFVCMLKYASRHEWMASTRFKSFKMLGKIPFPPEEKLVRVPDPDPPFASVAQCK